MRDARLKEILKLYTKEDLWNYNQEKLEQLAMKDHEIEILKNKKAKELADFLRESNAIQKTQNQKAIECLEDVKKYLDKDHKESNKLLQEETEDDYYIQAVGARMSANREYARYIDQKISKLKGE